jgi:hypothetical protein
MAIVRPSEEEARNLPPEQPIMVDSDAESNNRAVVEIERWCRSLGLLRVRETTLRELVIDGQAVWRGVCYRPSPVWSAAREAKMNALVEQIAADRADMPMTESSVDILRQE